MVWLCPGGPVFYLWRVPIRKCGIEFSKRSAQVSLWTIKNVSRILSGMTADDTVNARHGGGGHSM